MGAGKIGEYRQKLLNKGANAKKEETVTEPLEKTSQVKSSADHWKEKAKQRALEKQSNSNNNNNNIVMSDEKVKSVVEDVAIENKSVNKDSREVSEFDRFRRQDSDNKGLDKLNAFEKESDSSLKETDIKTVPDNKQEIFEDKKKDMEITKETKTQSNFYGNSLDKKVEEVYAQSSEPQVNKETNNIHTIEQNKHIQIENLESGSVRKTNTVNGGIGSNPSKDEAPIRLSCMVPEPQVLAEEVDMEPRTVLRAETEYKLAYVPVGVCKVIHEIIVAEVADTLVLGDKEFEVVLKPSKA